MLAPETRALLTDALRPPDGSRLDVAVATTYSLDLHALLLAPMSFAVHDLETADLDRVDPIKLLEAVRRYASKTTVFCQAGAIHIPGRYRRILTFAEGSVRQVVAPTAGRVFHPKIWVLRFIDPRNRYRHRFLCLSRNLTFDRSWDTIVRLDQADGETASGAPDCQPLAEFVAALPGVGVGPLDPERAASIASLANSLRHASFQLPPGITGLAFLPLGLGPEASWPFPDRMDRLLAVSAFLDTTTMTRLAAASKDVILLSRQESLDKVASPGTPPATQLFTLQRSAEVDVGGDAFQAVPLLNEASDAPDGLHAKTFIADVGDRAVIITGSANATVAGFGGNVEFDVAMEATRTGYGVSAAWEGSGTEAPGMARLCEQYTPRPLPEDQAAIAAREWEIDQFHAQLAALPLHLHVENVAEKRYALSMSPAALRSPGDTRLWPVSLSRQSFERQLDPAPRWEPIGLASITPFLAVETVIGSGGIRASRTALLKAELTGDPPERARDALRDMLRNQRDILRYLVFLLGDPAYEEWSGPGDGHGERWGAGTAAQPADDLALFEPLVRAAARGDDALERVASLVSELRAMPDAAELLPEGFDDIWMAVWAAYRTSGR